VAAEVASDRIVMTHEGGYNAVYSPICGQAVLQELSGIKLLEDPFGDSVDNYPSQQINQVQLSEISAAASLLTKVPTH
jgi:hypothetical protein